MSAPSDWLVAHRHLLPEHGDAMDVACGRGRNAIWLAEQGFRTVGVDRNDEAVTFLNHEAAERRLPLRAEVIDLENGQVLLPASAFDVIVVVHYLHRPLFPALVSALRPGGVLVYETFTRAQAARGKPTSPAHLLEPGELFLLVRPLRVLASREGDYDGKWIASVVASAQ